MSKICANYKGLSKSFNQVKRNHSGKWWVCAKKGESVFEVLRHHVLRESKKYPGKPKTEFKQMKSGKSGATEN